MASVISPNCFPPIKRPSFCDYIFKEVSVSYVFTNFCITKLQTIAKIIAEAIKIIGCINFFKIKSPFKNTNLFKFIIYF